MKYWKEILDDFRNTSKLSDSSEIQMKNCISRFLYIEYRKKASLLLHR